MGEGYYERKAREAREATERRAREGRRRRVRTVALGMAPFGTGGRAGGGELRRYRRALCRRATHGSRGYWRTVRADSGSGKRGGGAFART